MTKPLTNLRYTSLSGRLRKIGKQIVDDDAPGTNWKECLYDLWPSRERIKKIKHNGHVLYDEPPDKPVYNEEYRKR